MHPPATRKENLMRSLGLFVVGSLCGILLYDRLSGPDPTGLRAAQASAPRSSASGETRLQQLQHYQAVLQVLEIELARYQQLRKAELDGMAQDIKAAYRKTLNKDLQESWDRMYGPKKDVAANEKTQRTDDWYNREYEKQAKVEAKFQAYCRSLLDARSPNAKEWEKQFEGRPAEKEIHREGKLIALLTREGDEAQAALMHE
jgi:hypothetical protein